MTAFNGFEPEDIQIYPPLNKEKAQTLLNMTDHPGWSILLDCIAFEAEQYAHAALNTRIGPDALEKFRYYQAGNQIVRRLPAAILESVKAVQDGKNALDLLDDPLAKEYP